MHQKHPPAKVAVSATAADRVVSGEAGASVSALVEDVHESSSRLASTAPTRVREAGAERKSKCIGWDEQ